jgi:hypothetical protein
MRIAGWMMYSVVRTPYVEVDAKQLAVGLICCCRSHGQMSATWRRIMKKLIVALALMTAIAVPTFAQTANAMPGGFVSPSSSDFGP